ncbi:hypothetical protein A1343_07970 [Leptospira interrogans serovar Bataviae]|nr:hypothetical protein [Leptospira interrogans serovar Bataviae]OAM75213.1 hypothetical protein A1343_07970 [Leptospira interrogans serovar Bataviae]QOI39731.1 hypothetical protein Lepto1548_16675 [Leptospira interrogans serovar Bataviae]
MIESMFFVCVSVSIKKVFIKSKKNQTGWRSILDRKILLNRVFEKFHSEVKRNCFNCPLQYNVTDGELIFQQLY